MADQLPLAGVRAVIDNLNGYVRDAEAMNRATAGIGNAAVKAAADASRGAGGVSGLGKAAAAAGKDTEGLGTHIGQLGQNIGGLLIKLAPLAAGIAGAFAIGKGIEAVNELGATIFRLQQTTNLTAEEASQLKFLFDETGVSVQSGERAIIKFSRALGGVADLEDGIAIPTGKAMAETLFKLGIRTEDAEGKTRPLTDVLGDLAEQFKQMPEGIDKTSLATNLFGRNGKDLIPFLNEGRDGLQALAKEAGSLGLVLDQKTVNAIRQNELATKRFHSALEGISVQLGLIFLPALTVATQVGTKLAIAFNQKVTPALRFAANILATQFATFVRVTAPLFIRVFDQIGKSITVFRNAFFGALLTGNITGSLARLGFGFKVLAAVAAVLGASFRAAFLDIQRIIRIARVVGEIVRAVASDFTNFNRILAFFPTPVQSVVHAIEDIIEAITRSVVRLLDWGRSLVAAGTPLGTLGRAVGDLAAGPLDKFAVILDKLGKVIVPALGGVITAFIGLLAVGTVLAFVAAIQSLVAAFVGFAPVKLAGSILKDFLDLASAPIRFVFNVVKGVVDAFFTTLFDAAKAGVRVAVNVVKGVVDTIFDAVTGIFSGKDVTKKINLQSGTIDPEAAAILAEKDSAVTKTVKVETQGAPGADGGKLGQATGKGFLSGLTKILTAQAVQNVIASIVGAITGALVTLAVESETLSVVGIVASIGTAIAFALAAAAVVAAFAFVQYFVYKFAGLRGLIAFNVGGIFYLAILAAIPFVVRGIGRLIGITVKEFARLPGQLGTLLGGLGGVIAVALVGGLLILPVGIFRALRAGRRIIIEQLNEIEGDIGRFILRIVRFVAVGLTGLPAAFGTAAGAAARAFLRVVEGIPAFFERLPGRIAGTVASIPHIVVAAFAGLPAAVGAILSAIVGLAAALPAQLGKAIAAIPRIFTAVFEALDKITGGALSAIITSIRDFGLGVAHGFQDIWDNANRITNRALGRAVGDLADKLGTMLDKITTFADDVRRAFTTLANIIGSAFDGVAAVLGRVIDGIRFVVVGGFTVIREGVVDVFKGISGALSGVFGGVGDIITSALRGLAGLVADALSLIEPVISQIDDIIQTDYAGPIRAAIDALRGLQSVDTTRAPAVPAGSFQPGLPTFLAGGTKGPLLAPTQAIVGEEGRELAIKMTTPAQRAAGKGAPPAAAAAAIVGQRGPQVVNLPAGTVVLPHRVTERILQVVKTLTPTFQRDRYAQPVSRQTTMQIEKTHILPELARGGVAQQGSARPLVLTSDFLRALMPRGGSAGSEHDFMSRTAPTVVGGTNTLSRVLSALQAIPQRAAAVGGDTLFNVPIDVDARGLDWEGIRSRLHQEIDRQFISSRSRATRAGAPISGGLG